MKEHPFFGKTSRIIDRVYIMVEFVVITYFALGIEIYKTEKRQYKTLNKN